MQVRGSNVQGLLYTTEELDQFLATSCTGQRIVLPRSSCFSKEIVYIIYCERCLKCYFGKAGSGKKGDRTFRKRNGEHIRLIESIHDMLQSKGFYDDDGLIRNDLGIRAFVLKSLKKDFTGDVLHFVGLDGSECYTAQV
eukprot:343124_1